MKRPMCLMALIYIGLILLFTAKDVLGGNLLTKEELRLTDGETMWVYGEVEKKEPGRNSTGVTLKNAYVENDTTKTYKILVYVQNENSCQIGDKVKIQGKIKQLKKKTNKGMFHQALYYKAKKINYLCSGEGFLVLERKSFSVREKIYQFRLDCYEKLFRIFEEDTASLAGAILLGIKSDVEEEVKGLYQEAGIFHLISISGLHISFIGLSIYRILRKCTGSFGLSGVITGAFLMFYAILCGESVSALRAVIMALVMMTAWYLGRTYDLLSALSLAAILLLLDSPYHLYQAGFQLSFGAVLGICLVSKEFTKAFANENKLLEMVFSNLGIQFTTLPLILYYYCEIPVYSLALNLILVPCMSLVLGSGLFALVLGFFSLSLGKFAGGVMEVLLNLFEIFAGLSLKLPYANIRWGQPEIKFIILYYVLMFFSVYFLSKLNYKREELLKEEKEIKDVKGWAGCKKYVYLFIMCLSCFLLKYHNKPELMVTMLDVGQGDCLVMEAKDVGVFLVDGGSTDIKNVGKYRILPYLKAQGIKEIQGIFVSHMDSDHISGIKELLDAVKQGEFQIESVYLSDISQKDEAYLSLEEEIKNLKIPIVLVSRGMKLNKGMFTLNILQPEKEGYYQSENEASMVFQLGYGEFTMLFTGDVEGKGEKELLEQGMLDDIDVLKVAHHGSEYTTSQEMLDIVKPEISLISCGKDNSYGHPHKELLERLEGVNSKIYITKEVGAVTLETDGVSVVLYHM